MSWQFYIFISSHTLPVGFFLTVSTTRPTGDLDYQYTSVSQWFQNISSRVQLVDNLFRQMQTNDPAHDARRLAALNMINHIKSQLINSNFYATQQYPLPYLHAKRLENQLNAVGWRFLPGIWKTGTCGSGMFWNICGGIVRWSNLNLFKSWLNIYFSHSPIKHFVNLSFVQTQHPFILRVLTRVWIGDQNGC